MDGILIINKERGYTSFDVVARLRGILHQKKIGHTGTLDPEATGVLPVCLGRATKAAGLLTDTDKIYEAVMLLGVTTDTQDMTGTILRERPVRADEEDIRTAVQEFTGEILQVPPMYSALKVNGRKLVDLARAGQVIERKPRPVTVYRAEILACRPPRVKMRVECSRGTYIRTLCHDIGERLGCGAAMDSLVRVRAGGYSLDQAMTLDEVEARQRAGTLEAAVRPLADLFADLPRFTVCGEEGEKRLNNGNLLPPECGRAAGEIRSGRTAVYRGDGSFAAVYGWDEETQMLRPVKMFL